MHWIFISRTLFIVGHLENGIVCTIRAFYMVIFCTNVHANFTRKWSGSFFRLPKNDSKIGDLVFIRLWLLIGNDMACPALTLPRESVYIYRLQRDTFILNIRIPVIAYNEIFLSNISVALF